MKKQVLLGVAIGIGSFAFAQSSQLHKVVTPAKLKASVASHKELYTKQVFGGETDPTPTSPSLVNTVKIAPHHEPSRAYTTTVIGNTGYQLQTNYSVCNRVVKSPDGTLSATWTYSSQQATWSDRGTGYNYFDGAAWGPAPTVRVENARTGFTNLGITVGGAEVIIAHEAADLHISSRAAKGTGAWSNAAWLGSPDVWSRMAVGGSNGTTLHVISQTTGVGGAPFMGQDGALAYSRSLDGGTTWDKLHTVIPEIDAASYLGFSADVYAIDAKGDTIAIVAGGQDVDVVMIKSVDNGETWTKSIVKAFPIPMYDGTTMNTDMPPTDGFGDTLDTNDGSLAILLDNQGRVHVWYGLMKVVEEPGEAGLSYFPGTAGLMYWNECMAPNTPVLIATAVDLDSDGILNVTAWGNYQSGFVTMPNAGVDPAGNIYVSYSGIFEGDAENGTPGDGLSYRHTYVMSSPDGGETWCMPTDVSDPPGPFYLGYTEGVYGAMAKDVDGFIHLFVQTDGSPGNGLSGTTPDPQSGSADILYKKIPVADVNTCTSTLVPCVLTSVQEQAASISSMVLYPNPASTVANLELNVAKKGKVSVKIYNVTGQIISEITNQEYAAGKYNINVNLEKMQSGIYMIQMISDNTTSTKKMIVK